MGLLNFKNIHSTSRSHARAGMRNLILVTLIAGMICIGRPAGAVIVFIDTFENIGADGTEVSTRELGGVTMEMSVATGASILAYSYFDNTPLTFGGGLARH